MNKKNATTAFINTVNNEVGLIASSHSLDAEC